jgi:hypothetical protein
MKYTYDFEIADLLIRVESPFCFTDLHELSPFLIRSASNRPPDAHYTIDLLPKNWSVNGTKLADLPRSTIYQSGEELHRYYFWNVFSQDRFVLVTASITGKNHQTIYLQEETLERILPQFRLAAFLFPEHMLLQNQAYLLHASVVRYQGKGILFAGPSGIGKSTQAELWIQTQDAELLNGDRAILRRQDDCWRAYGSPYAGTSGIYRNSSVPLQAIVVLSQGRENTLCNLTPSEAFGQLLPQTAAMPWCQQYMAKLSDLLLDTIATVPVYHLSCLPTPDAVSLLKKQLQSHA